MLRHEGFIRGDVILHLHFKRVGQSINWYSSSNSGKRVKDLTEAVNAQLSYFWFSPKFYEYECGEIEIVTNCISL